MSRLNQYLTEARSGIVEKIKDEKKVSKLLKGNYSDAWKGTPIYRNMDDHGDFLLYDGGKEGSRESAHTSNYYTLVINEDKSWNGYPKRKLICFTEPSSRAKTYRVLPMNGVKIGVCSSMDIWYSFKDIYVHILNRQLTRLFGGIDKDENMAMFKRACTAVDKKMRTVESKEYMKKKLMAFDAYGDLIYKGIEKHGGMYNFYVELLNPKRNKFKVVKAGDRIPKKREVWIDGKALLIKHSNMVDFKLEEHN